MVTATELGRPEFALHWHEAVAIVAETAAILLDRGITSVPDPASVVLSPDGRLHLLDVGDAPPTPAPGRRLGSMLDVLLASSACPPELRRLTDESLADPPAFATIEEFANALAFFERPGRDELLAGVAARASEAELEARANTELERLEARTRDVKRKIQPRPDETPSHSNRKHMALLFAGSLIVSIAAGAILGLRAIDSEARERGAPALTERVRARVDRIAARGLEAVGLRTPAPPAATPAAEVKPPAVAPRPSRRAPQPAPPTISVKDLTGGHVVALHSTVAPEAPAPVVHDEAVYASDAEDVEPAVLTRPHLPSRPPEQTASEEIGFLEIIVSASGAVEQVRLISTTNRFQDRMIVAAAKAWQFAPATKNGLPVRYRTRIRITL
jgi:TonB family protein